MLYVKGNACCQPQITKKMQNNPPGTGGYVKMYHRPGETYVYFCVVDNISGCMTNRKRPRSRDHTASRNDLLYGAHAVAAALANPARRCLQLWATSNALSRHGKVIENSGIVTERVRPDVLDRKLGAGAVHQGLLLEAAPLEEPSLHDLAPGGVLVVLDQVSDPHNVGAVLRSCAAFGARGLILTERHSPSNTGVLAKAASGALEHVPLIRVTNLVRALGSIAELGHVRIGLDGDAGQDLADVDLSGGVALVLGAEGKGLRRLTAEHCDWLAHIATPGPLSSLNVSNAAAVSLYICTANPGR